MKINDKAAALKTKLFDLAGEFRLLQQAAAAAGQHDAAGELDDVACRLAAEYGRLPDVCSDACRDTADQEFSS